MKNKNDAGFELTLGSQTGDHGFFADIFYTGTHYCEIHEHNAGKVKLKIYHTLEFSPTELEELLELLNKGAEYVTQTMNVPR